MDRVKRSEFKINLEKLRSWLSNLKEAPEYGSWKSENGKTYLKKGSKYFGWSVFVHSDKRPGVNGCLLRKSYPGILHTDFKNKSKICYGYLEEILKQFPRAFRASIIGLYPGFQYLPHKDAPEDSFRMHIAIQTNPQCQMKYGNEYFHIPADGFIWMAKTDETHLAFNLGNEPRIHLTWQMPMTKDNDF
ncbi:MAG: aspartyl/asparaginyl beta-hydroxylase domain-containing protein [Bdellovibrionales bacterium]|nr:aspartyl/asparaginyl beta-hydroxylase domain-containing protein [Bdellovibrionales bacterium]